MIKVTVYYKHRSNDSILTKEFSLLDRKQLKELLEGGDITYLDEDRSGEEETVIIPKHRITELRIIDHR